MNARRGIFVAPFEELSEPGLVQGPPIPVWVAARWPHRRPLRRAARFDGLFPIDLPGPDALAELAAELPELERRFDLVVTSTCASTRETCGRWS
ncbi:MAG: hypothetical protein ACRDL4_12465 [Thermoleophilaceae bacterium]